jgi:hypothetical protein
MSCSKAYRHFNLLIALLFLCSLSFGCSGILGDDDTVGSSGLAPIEPATVASITHHIQPEVPDTTTTLDQKLAGIAANVTHGTDTIMLASATNNAFANASDVGIKAGEILAGGVSGQTPHGYLKKVKAVRHENGNIYIDVEPVSLEKAIKNAHFNFRHPLKRKDVVSFSPAMAGVKLNDTEFVSDDVSLKIDVVIYDLDGNLKTTYDQIKATGKIDLVMSLDGDVQIEWFQMTQLKFYGKFKESLSLTVGASVPLAKLKKEFLLGSFAISPVTFFVGPVPVVIVPKINLNLTFDGSVAVNASLGVTQNLTFAAGLQANNGNVSPYTEGPVFTVVPSETTGVKAAIEISAGPEVEASIYGLAGPTIGVDVYFSAEASAKQSNLAVTSDLELKAGLKGKVSGQIDALAAIGGKLELTIFDIVFWKQTIPLYDSKGGAPAFYPAGLYDGVR